MGSDGEARRVTETATAAHRPVERVGPGVWCIPVPLPIPRIRHVLVYAYMADDGVYLVDAGWDTPAGMAALSDGLDACGASLSAVRGVIVTHAHPDHFGLAGPIRSETGAWVAMHRDDAPLAVERYRTADAFDLRTQLIMELFGVPAADRADVGLAPLLSRQPTALIPDMVVEDGQCINAGRELRVVSTPGHSPGHISVWDERDRRLMTGDCVLPSIRTSLAFDPDGDEDPLARQLASFEALMGLDVAEVLPGHEHRFIDLHRRIEDLTEHHEARCRRAFEAVGAGASTAWEVAPLMHARRWSDMDGRRRRAAMGEAAVHLRHLARRGALVERKQGSVLRWSIADPFACELDDGVESP